MAVSSLIVHGALTGTFQSVTIQPASGTVYTFKRGRVARHTSTGPNFIVGGGYASLQCEYYSFSEAGVTSTVGSTTTHDAGSSYFSAVGNDATSFINSYNANDVRYALVGVSMT